jgi:stage V sporulation protein B
MLPTALSQVIEAGGKLFLGLAFAAYARGTGADLSTSAAYAVLGLTVGTGLSVLYLLIHKRMTDTHDENLLLPSTDTSRPVMRPLLATAIPVTLSAGVISLTKCVDLALILRRLQSVGYTVAEANALYGCYSTLAVPVFNILPSLTTSVALSAVPALSAAFRKGKEGREELRKTSLSSLELTLTVAIPASLGIAVFAEDILALLFAGQPAAAAQAAPWLSCLGLSVPAACLVTVTGAMLQAAGKANRPVISMLIGVVAKTFLAYVLLGLDGWGLAGAPVSSLLCDTVIVAVNLFFISRHAPAMLPHLREGISLVAFPVAVSVLAVGGVKLLRYSLGWQEITPLHTLGTVASVMCLYGAGLLLKFAFRFYIPIHKKKDLQHDQVNQRSA